MAVDDDGVPEELKNLSATELRAEAARFIWGSEDDESDAPIEVKYDAQSRKDLIEELTVRVKSFRY